MFSVPHHKKVQVLKALSFILQKCLPKTIAISHMWPSMGNVASPDLRYAVRIKYTLEFNDVI